MGSGGGREVLVMVTQALREEEEAQPLASLEAQTGRQQHPHCRVQCRERVEMLTSQQKERAGAQPPG